MASNVTLTYGNLTETIPLFEGRLHIPTIKDAFTLRVAKFDGALAPVDSQGFTYAIFKPGDTLNISGTSADSAAMPGTPHSMCLLQWRLVPWYNMICTIPGTLQTAMMQSTSWGIVVVCFVSGTLKGFISEVHSGAILQIVQCTIDATSQSCYKWGLPLTALHTALLHMHKTRNPIRQMCLSMLSLVTVLRMLHKCISACQCTALSSISYPFVWPEELLLIT